MVAGTGPRDRKGFSTQRSEEGTAVVVGTREEDIPMQAGAGVSGQVNTRFFVVTTEGGIQLKQLIRLLIKLRGGGVKVPPAPVTTKNFLPTQAHPSLHALTFSDVSEGSVHGRGW